MVTAGTSSRSRGAFRPGYAISLLPLGKRGRRGAGCALHPRSRVPRNCALAHTSIQGSGEHTDIPCAMVLRLTSCSSRWSELVVTVAPKKRTSQELFASIRGARTTRLDRTQQNHSPLDRRVHRIPRPTCRDDGDTPLMRARDSVGYNSDFQKCKAKYFVCRTDSPNQPEIAQEIRFSAQPICAGFRMLCSF
jgi:hypothetical protein